MPVVSKVEICIDFATFDTSLLNKRHNFVYLQPTLSSYLKCTLDRASNLHNIRYCIMILDNQKFEIKSINVIFP